MTADRDLTLTDLLMLPGWRDAQILAGQEHLGQRIQQVQVAVSLSVTDIASGALIIVAAHVNRTDWRIDALLRKAADANAAAVVLDGESPLMPATRHLADRIVVPVLGIAANSAVELALTARELLSSSLALKARLVLEANQTLMSSAPDPAKVCQLMHDILGVPVAVIDRDKRCLAGDLPFRPTESTLGPIATRWSASAVAGASVPVTDADAATNLWLVASCPAARQSWLDVVVDILALGAGALQRWRTTARLMAERDARHRSILLTEILQLTGPPSPGLRTRIQKTDWVLDGWHLGFFFTATPSFTPGELVREVETSLGRSEAAVVAVAEHANGCAGWFTHLIEPTESSVVASVAALRASHRTLRQSIDCSLGVGRVHVGPRGIAETLGEAIGGARLAERRAESGHFVDVRRFGVSDLLLAWTRTESFMPVARDLLAPLEQLGPELLETLTIFLDVESSLTETAAILGIHRNTVAARILRVRHLIGSDLTDPDERLALQLACRAIATTG